MANQIDWPAENIPNEDNVFYRIHKMWIEGGEPVPGSFRNRDGAMSTDWSKYSTAEQTRQRATSLPADNGIVLLNVGEIRSVPNQIVSHAPLYDNRAHSHVIGEKDTEVRLKLLRICRWAINLEPDLCP